MVDAREYHERSKHTPESVRRDSFSLDFASKPRPTKQYRDLPRITIGESPEPPDMSALPAIAAPYPEPRFAEIPMESEIRNGSEPVDATDLQTLCQYATGITKELEIQGQRTPFRAAACTGKLYHIDLYAVTGDLAGLDPGVYHFDPPSGDFDVVREGDYRGVLARASGAESVGSAPMTLVVTSQWWRNAWKYRERTYRHAFWDSGTTLANLLATAHALGHRASVVTGFADDPVAELVGVDPEREAPLELVPIGRGETVPKAPTVEPIDPAEEPLSPEVVEYPLVPDAWRQSRLEDGATARGWLEEAAGVDGDAFGTHGPGGGRMVELDPVDRETASSRPLANTIERRGSLREYSHESLSDRLFATVLDRALRGIPVDVGDSGGGQQLVDVYTLVHAVDGVESGAYQYHPAQTTLERLGDTDRETAGRLALGQSVVGDAAANVYIMADVDALVAKLGNRGYRVAQLLGGVSLGRLYLATYAHRKIGGRGFTFFDDLVTEHLSPRAEDQTPMTLFAFGKPAD